MGSEYEVQQSAGMQRFRHRPRMLNGSQLVNPDTVDGWWQGRPPYDPWLPRMNANYDVQRHLYYGLYRHRPRDGSTAWIDGEPPAPIKAQGVARIADNDRALVVVFSRKPSDTHLREFHDFIREWNYDG